MSERVYVYTYYNPTRIYNCNLQMKDKLLDTYGYTLCILISWKQPHNEECADSVAAVGMVKAVRYYSIQANIQ